MHEGLPPVHDEAGLTPMWVPAAGLAVFVLLAATLLYRLATPVATAPSPSDGAAPSAEPAAARLPAESPPAAAPGRPAPRLLGAPMIAPALPPTGE